MITIHYDFTDGTEVSYIEGKNLKDNFTTSCLSFFMFDNGAENVIVVDKANNILDRNKLLLKHNYCMKEIRKEHNICKMLIANAFTWQHNKGL